MIDVEIANRQAMLPVDEGRLVHAVRTVLRQAGIVRGVVSVAVVDDPEIHRLNRQHLRHNYPTDVLSFLLEAEEGALEGEIIVSADTARTSAPHFDWNPADELLLYVIHGALHLVGYDDQTPDARQVMRRQEAAILALFDLAPRYAEDSPGEV